MNDVNNRGNQVWGIWELSVLLPHFFCKSKTILKTKVKKILISAKTLLNWIKFPDKFSIKEQIYNGLEKN